MHLAAQTNNMHVISRLIEEGGDIFKEDAVGNTPVQLAHSRCVLLKMCHLYEQRHPIQYKAAPFNIHEPAIRLLDYVAIMAFNANTKETKVRHELSNSYDKKSIFQHVFFDYEIIKEFYV